MDVRLVQGDKLVLAYKADAFLVPPKGVTLLLVVDNDADDTYSLLSKSDVEAQPYGVDYKLNWRSNFDAAWRILGGMIGDIEAGGWKHNE